MANHCIALDANQLMVDDKGLSGVLMWCMDRMDEGIQLPRPPMLNPDLPGYYQPLFVYIDNDEMATELRLRWSEYVV